MSIINALDQLSGSFNREEGGPAVRFENVGLTLSSNQILHGLSFTVAPGSVHCIIGPNGGGKTSLMRSLLGQMPHEGTIAVDWPGKRVVGYMPQILDFDRTLPVTVMDFMAMICQVRPAFFGLSPKHREAVRTTLRAVGMSEKKDRIFGQLSGGEKQRVLLAQSLNPIPGLLVLDEPMAGVDDSFTPVFEEIVAYLKDLGVTIIWISHDLKQVMRLADGVTCVNRKMLFSGPPSEYINSETVLDLFSQQG